MKTIDSRQLDALADAGAVKSVVAQGTTGGFTIIVDGRLIEAKRGHARVFRKLQAAASFLKKRGIGSFTVDVSKWAPPSQEQS